jgi:hypothetical protein
MYKEQMDVQGISIYKYIFVTNFGYVLRSKDCVFYLNSDNIVNHFSIYSSMVTTCKNY